MESMGNKLRRAFDMEPLPNRRGRTAQQAKRVAPLSASRRAASLDMLSSSRRTRNDAMFTGRLEDAIDIKTGCNKFVLWCVEAIEANGDGLKTDALYRGSWSQDGVRKIARQHERGMQQLLMDREQNIHVLTGALKLFFKSLHVPILRFEELAPALQPHFNDVETVQYLWQMIQKLPLVERKTLACLFLHLRRVLEEEQNRMTLALLSATFGPTLMRADGEFSLQATMADDMKQHNRLVELLLMHSDAIFGETKIIVAIEKGINQGIISVQNPPHDSLSSSFESESDDQGTTKTTKVLVANVNNYKRNSSFTKEKTSRDTSPSDSSHHENEILKPAVSIAHNERKKPDKNKKQTTSHMQSMPELSQKVYTSSEDEDGYNTVKQVESKQPDQNLMTKLPPITMQVSVTSLPSNEDHVTTRPKIPEIVTSTRNQSIKNTSLQAIELKPLKGISSSSDEDAANEIVVEKQVSSKKVKTAPLAELKKKIFSRKNRKEPSLWIEKSSPEPKKQHGSKKEKTPVALTTKENPSSSDDDEMRHFSSNPIPNDDSLMTLSNIYNDHDDTKPPKSMPNMVQSNSSFMNDSQTKSTFAKSIQNAASRVKQQFVSKKSKPKTSKTQKSKAESSASSDEENSVIGRPIEFKSDMQMDPKLMTNTNIPYHKPLGRPPPPPTVPPLKNSSTKRSSKELIKPIKLTNFSSSQSDLQVSTIGNEPEKDIPEYATVKKVKPSAILPDEDIYKPTPKLTEVFNSSSLHMTDYLRNRAPAGRQSTYANVTHSQQPVGDLAKTNEYVVYTDTKHTTQKESVTTNVIHETKKEKKSKDKTSSSDDQESFSDSSDEYVPTAMKPSVSTSNVPTAL